MIRLENKCSKDVIEGTDSRVLNLRKEFCISRLPKENTFPQCFVEMLRIEVSRYEVVVPVAPTAPGDNTLLQLIPSLSSPKVTVIAELAKVQIQQVALAPTQTSSGQLKTSCKCFPPTNQANIFVAQERSTSIQPLRRVTTMHT